MAKSGRYCSLQTPVIDLIDFQQFEKKQVEYGGLKHTVIAILLFGKLKFLVWSFACYCCNAVWLECHTEHIYRENNGAKA